MSRSMCRRIGGWAAVILAFVADPTFGQHPKSVQKVIEVGNSPAYGNGSRQKVLTFSTQSQSAYLAVLGEVGRPGTYEVTADSRSVRALIKLAGGLTENAQPSARIIRQEQIVQQVFFTSPDADAALVPGDVLLIEARPTNSSVSRVVDPPVEIPEVTPAVATQESNDPAGVQIALINVLDYPIITKVRSEEADLDTIIQAKLGQPADLAGTIKVLDPTRSRRVVRSTTADRRLGDGSVIVFPKNSVDRRRLPKGLPVPINSEIIVGARPVMIDGQSRSANELHDVGNFSRMIGRNDGGDQGHPASDGNLVLPPSIPSVSDPGLALPPRQTGDDVPAMSETRPNPRIATIPFQGMPTLRSSSVKSISTDTDAATGDSGNSPKLNRDTDPADQIDGGLDANDETSPSQSGGQFTLSQFLGMMSAVCAVIGLAFLTRRIVNNEQTRNTVLSRLNENIGTATTSRNKTKSEIDPVRSRDRIETATVKINAATANSGEITQPPIIESPSTISPPVLSQNQTENTGDNSSSEIETTPQTTTESMPPDFGNEITNEVSTSSTGLSNVETEENDQRPTTTTAPMTRDSQSISVTSASLLEGLIHNTLPVQIEPVHFSEGLVLQGQVAPRPTFRVDKGTAGVGLNGPHFSMSAAARGAVPATESRSEPMSIQSRIDPPQSIGDGSVGIGIPEAGQGSMGSAIQESAPVPHFLRKRPLKKEMALSQASTEMGNGAGAGRSSTPLSDALRHLQGETT